MDILEVYADESCKEGHQYLGLGGIAVEKTKLSALLAALDSARASNFTSEIKWSSMRRSKLNAYKNFINPYFKASLKDDAHFHCLLVDTTKFDHATFSDGSDEIGFNKLIFQLLLHRFGKRYGKHYAIHVYLDKREGAQDPEIIRPMLNAVLKRDHGIATNPFRLIRFKDSRDTDILQANDLLLGAFASRKNGHHLREDASPEKVELGNHIEKCAKYLVRPFGLGSRFARKFSVWDFNYKKRGS